MVRNKALTENDRLFRIKTKGDPIQNHLADIVPDGRRIGVFRGQRMPVRHKEKTVHLILNPDPVFKNTMKMAYVQTPRRPHAADNALFHQSKLLMTSCSPIGAGAKNCKK